MGQNLNFPAKLRIKSRKQIEFLFENPSSLFVHPFLLKYHIAKLPEAQVSSPQFAVTVPKRSFKKAHDRNLLKRRIREAYRIHWQKHFPESSHYEVLLMFIFVGKKMENYDEIEKAMLQVFQKLKKFDSIIQIQYSASKNKKQ